MANGTVRTAAASGAAGGVIGAVSMVFYLLTKAMIPIGTIGSLTLEESTTVREMAAFIFGAIGAGGARVAYLWLRGHFDLESPVTATALLALMVGLGTLPFLGGCVGRADYRSPLLVLGLGDVHSATCVGTATVYPDTEVGPGRTTCEGRLISTQGAHEGENAMKTIDGFWTAVSSALKFLTPAGLVP